jgi:hypothetical protein
LMGAPLPDNVELTSVDEIDGGVLLRLHHIFEKREESPVLLKIDANLTLQLAKPMQVDLKGLFAGRTLASVEEQSLTGNGPRRSTYEVRREGGGVKS